MSLLILIGVVVIVIILVLFTSTKSNSKMKKKSHFYRVENIAPSLFTINPALKTIRAELFMVNSWRDWPEKMLYPDGSWKIIPIFAFGKWYKPYCDQVPTLTYLLKKIPELKTALFSRMLPYTVVEPHQGLGVLSNNIIRCHLGIDIPGTSYVAIGDERQYHKNNKWFAFDDSQMHYGCNMSSWLRTVLIVDIKRPTNIPKGISRVVTSDELVNLLNDILVDK